MRRPEITLLVSCAAFGIGGITTASAAEPAGPLLAPHFQSGMVLQRQAPVRIHGVSPAKSQVQVTLNGKPLRVTIDRGGAWSAEIPPQRASRGNTIAVSADAEAVQVADVAFGDVWLCSGQSNMDLPVLRAADSVRTAREAAKSSIRIAKVGRVSAPQPVATPKFDVSWQAANEQSVSDFSAVCWHFGLALEKKIDAPIGLIHAAWGGTSIEDWISADGLAGIPKYRSDLAKIAQFAADPGLATRALSQENSAWAVQNDPGSQPQRPWYAPDLSTEDWTKTVLPGPWERAGIPALSNFDGVVWYRRTFELTAAQAGGTGRLDLGTVDERDAVWMNGRKIGEELQPSVRRRYEIAPGVLREGRNVIAIQVVDLAGSGGLSSGNAGSLPLTLANGSKIDLAGEWSVKPSISRADWTAPPPFVPWVAPRGLTTLYNGMIAPLTSYPLKGVVWYQGESNANDYENYAELSRAWMADWRDAFASPDLPFVIAQLPNYGRHSNKPSADSRWGGLREAQRQAVAADKRAGLAITIDQGVTNDIHPAHKLIVGERLASEALRIAYGDRSALAAPSLASVSRVGADVRVRFQDTGGALVTYGGDMAIGFELCDPAKQCRFATGRVVGDDVVLSGADRSTSIVRYAFADSPIVNLYGRTGLPVAPFSAALHD